MTTFTVGQKVIATGPYMHQLTEGKEYTVTAVEPEVCTTTFTWPEYTTVIGDSGKPVTGHSHRWRAA